MDSLTFSRRAGVDVYVGMNARGNTVAVKRLVLRSEVMLTQMSAPANKQNLVKLLVSEVQSVSLSPIMLPFT